ncbi:MAG TPA: cyclodeaminase [Acidimicrobiia bacterium]|nr:cyclodeaminase [Acidimicrobiia bacterium]
MGTIRVLTETELREAVGLGQEELDVIEAVYPLVTAGVGSMPPIMRIDVPESNGEIDIKSAYLPGYPGIAVKVSAGFFDNPERGLPSLGGLMLVFDSETGVPQSALFDNGYLTDLRTALAGAVAAKHLAIAGASVAAVLGAGVQARLQTEALAMVRPIELVRIWARRLDQSARLSKELSERLHLEVEPASTPHEAVEGADVLVTTTPATEPLVTESMLHPGLHITAVGSDAEGKQEISVGAITAADGFFCDSIAQSARLGELRAAIASGFDRELVCELGAVIAGDAFGRGSDVAVTICDLTGTGAQDTAIASLAVERCDRAGAGIAIET